MEKLSLKKKNLPSAQIFAFLSKSTSELHLYSAHQQIFLSDACSRKLKNFLRKSSGTSTLFSFDIFYFLLFQSSQESRKNDNPVFSDDEKEFFVFLHSIEKNTKMYRLCKFYKLLNK